MPMEWTEPELFLTHKGVGIWRTYKAGCVTSYHFTVICENDDVEGYESETGGQFDVRDLKSELKGDLRIPPGTPEDDAHRMVIRQAIEEGIFDSWEKSAVEDSVPASSWKIDHEIDTDETLVSGGEGRVRISGVPPHLRAALAREIKHLMENPDEMTAGRRVAVYVSGGCVSKVTASSPGVRLLLVDYDDYGMGQDDRSVAALQWAEAEAERTCKHPTKEA